MDEFSPHGKSFYEELALRLQQGYITDEERALLEKWYNKGQDDPVDVPMFLAKDEEAHGQMLFRQIKDRIKTGELECGDDSATGLRKDDRWKWWTAAASFLLLVSVCAYWLFSSHTKIYDVYAVPTAHTDMVPGHSGAILRLSNGTEMTLDSLKDGVVATHGNLSIVKKNGELKYVGNTDAPLFNEIITNKGRQWKLVLPDGTKVQLNAASSIRYPISMHRDRTVEMDGEAYFEVVHNPSIPFRVRVWNRVVEDIGTIFNVSAYGDESVSRTTLVEGVVQVDGIRLKPGQQAQYGQKGAVSVKKVNVADVTAWINGRLSLDNIALEELMRQIGRWYDVDIVFTGKVSNKHFGGLLDRNLSLSDLVEALKYYGINIHQDGRKIIVSP